MTVDEGLTHRRRAPSLRTNILGNSAMMVVAQLSGSLFIILGSIAFEKAQFGHIVTATAALVIGATVLNLGTLGSLPHYVALARNDGNQARLHRLVAVSLGAIALACAAGALMVALSALALGWPNSGSGALAAYWLPVCLGMPMLALAKAFAGVLYGLSRLTSAAFINLVLLRLTPLATMIAIWQLGGPPIAVLVAYTATTGLMLAAGIVFTWADLRPPGKLTPSPLPSGFLGYTLNCWLTQITMMIRGRGQAALFALLLTSADVAAVAVAASLVSPLQSLLNALGPPIRPVATVMIHNRRHSELPRVHKRVAALATVAVTAAGATGFVYAGDIVITLLGSDYQDTIVYFRVLILFYAVAVSMGTVNPFLLALDKPDTLRRIEVFVTLAFLVAVVALVPVFGPMAAVLAIGAVFLTMQTAKMLAVRREIALSWYDKRQPLFLLGALVLAVAAHQGVRPLPGPDWAWVYWAPLQGGLTILWGWSLGLVDLRRPQAAVAPRRADGSPGGPHNR